MREREVIMTKNTLFRRFIIQSIISFLLTGGLLIYFVSSLVVENEINHNIEVVSLTLGHSLDHWFEDVDIHELELSDLDALDAEFESLDRLGNIADIRIWSIEGELIYSQDRTLIGNVFIEEEHLEAAMSGTTDYELLPADSEEAQLLGDYGNEFIELYLPITDHHTTIGVFELYRSFDPSRASINESIRSIIMTLSFGLIIMYLFLARAIYNGSNKLLVHTNELAESFERLNRLFRSMITAITKAIDARDKFTSGHSQRVVDFTVGFAYHLGLDKKDIDQLEVAGILHDIGKLGVPEALINKPERLTDEEFAQIKKHPVIGEQIIEDIEELQGLWVLLNTTRNMMALAIQQA